MLKLLVAVDRSLEASIALRTACFLGSQVRIQPIYVVDPPGRDMTFGAGWAWKSWERETSQQAEENIEDLVISERSQCPNIDNPIILTGEPFQKISSYSWENDFDLVVTGAPFRGLEPKALLNRFAAVARKAEKSIPLLVMRHLKDMQRIVAFTDGGASAEKALGILIRLVPPLSADIVLIALAQGSRPSPNTETLNLERGLAIFREKGIEVSGRTLSNLDPGKLQIELQGADLVVGPMEDSRTQVQDLLQNDIRAALFCIGRD
ncbi:MAG: universal stress protein [Desulfocapsaceae bacterium]|nr:universal stress protein [Desulfocapsaceae bacterium]